MKFRVFPMKLQEQEHINRELMKDIALLQKQQSAPSKLGHSDQKTFGNRSVKSTERSVSVRRKPNAGLTPLNIQMLKTLILLQMENSKRGISMRELAAEIYPSKPYPKIKSTLSEYVKKLHQTGLIEKHLSGRLFISFTQKALEYADEHRLNKMNKLISEPFGKSFGVR